MNPQPFGTRRIGRYLVLFALLCALLLSARDAVATTRYVVAGSSLCTTITSTPCYGSIQAALNQSVSGDALEIRPGVHTVGEVDVTVNLAAVYGDDDTAGTILTGGGPSSAAILKFSNVTGPLIIHHLTFYNAGTGIEISNTASTIDIYNNIFELGSEATAISAAGQANPKVYNNTFYRNLRGILANLTTLSIFSNIFYQNSNSSAISPATMVVSGILNNLFYGGNVGPVFDPLDLKGNIFSEDPLFVAPDLTTVAERDFHLKSGSPAIDKGYSSSGNDTVDDTLPDIGVYGGSKADTIPSTVTNVIASAVTPTATSVTVSWSANNDYRVKGYKVYHRLSTASSTTYIDPPLFVTGSTITTTVISGLTATAATPVQPVMNKPDPRDGRLILSWTTDTRASDYDLHYSLESAPTVTTTIQNIGNANNYTLSGLTNNVRYWISVTPLAQPTIYTAVTASYNPRSGFLIGPGVGFESPYSTEVKATFGDLVTGPTSTPVLGIPEPVVPYPNLPNTGCFIATAAYGEPDALPVRILREFRDRRLLTHPAGRAVVAWYYRTSPALAAKLNGHPAAKPFVRAALEPVVATAAVITYAPAAVILAVVVLLFPVRRLLRRRAS